MSYLQKGDKSTTCIIIGSVMLQAQGDVLCSKSSNFAEALPEHALHKGK